MYCNRSCSALASHYRRKHQRPVPPRWQHPAWSSHAQLIRAAAARADQLGQEHSWNRSSTRCVLDGLVTVLEGRPAGERVPLSEVRSATHRHVSTPRLAEVLADLQLLHDDTVGLAPGLDRPQHRNPGDGFRRTGPRLAGRAARRGRSRHTPFTGTLYAYLSSIRALLTHWATQYGHLREVINSDIYAALDLLRGYPRNNAIEALRSLFGFAKKRVLIFTNPTIGLRARQIDPALVPMTDEEIRLVEQLAAKPAQRLAIALAAEHAARTGTTRNLTLVATWTCPTGASPSTGTTSGSVSSPAGHCSSGSITVGQPDRAHPTGHSLSRHGTTTPRPPFPGHRSRPICRAGSER